MYDDCICEKARVGQVSSLPGQFPSSADTWVALSWAGREATGHLHTETTPRKLRSDGVCRLVLLSVLGHLSDNVNHVALGDAPARVGTLKGRVSPEIHAGTAIVGIRAEDAAAVKVARNVLALLLCVAARVEGGVDAELIIRVLVQAIEDLVEAILADTTVAGITVADVVGVGSRQESRKDGNDFGVHLED